MGNLGVFRDDFYNAIHVLAEAQALAQAAAASGTIPATSLAGAAVCYVVASGGAAVTETTDTAVNIIAQLSNAVNAAYKANVGGFASSLGAQPAVSGIPNLFNTSWIVTLNNQNSATITVAPGTGVTLAALGGLSPTAVLTVTSAVYVVTVTSAQTITMTRVQ